MKNKMYHLSLYFDEKTNQKLSFLSEQIKEKLHQNYLEKHHIPFHLTIATYKEIEEKKFIVVDELKFDEIKTKAMKNVLANLKADKALVILNDNDQNVVLSARNIEGVETALTNTINVFDLLKHNTVVVTKAAVETIEEVYA